MPKNRWISIRGAREHNLKDISLDIPRNSLVVITGLSGSGKSSLAFETIYAEGQRRYVESLSVYARQFLEQMHKPDVDAIEGLSPAIAIQQSTSIRNPRSTVGTVTEIYDYLRLLFARVGKPYCPECGREIRSQTTEEIVERIMGFDAGTRIQLLGPIVEERKGAQAKLIDRLRKEGFTRVKIDGEMRLLEEEIVLEKNKKHSVSVVVDRLVIKEGVRRRLTDSMELTLSLSDGKVIVDFPDNGEMVFSQNAVCRFCGTSIPQLSPQMFSFNNPQGACTTCKGLGSIQYFDPNLIVPDPNLSLRDGALAPWASRNSEHFKEILHSLCNYYGISMFTPFNELPKNMQEILLYGSGKDKVPFHFRKGAREYSYVRPFEGILTNLDRRYHGTDSANVRDEIARYMNARECPDCDGTRLKAVSRAVRVGDRNICEITSRTVEGNCQFFNDLKLEAKEESMGRRVLKEITDRLGFLEGMGLGYLTLERSSATLSGGEYRRIKLATQIGSGLAGVLYVLDEPSIGLHQRDNIRLLDNLRHLKEMGNTVLIVEHDAETISWADQVIDMGPGAGEEGGKVVFQGPPEILVQEEKSLTGQYLAGKKYIPLPNIRRKGTGESIVIEEARENNLKNITVTIPLGAFTCVTGVSGSGKSTLINDILFPTLSQILHRSGAGVGRVKSIRGAYNIDKVLNIDQNPIGKTPRSNPATYTGVFAPIRELFSMLPEARARGYKPGRFSFNVKGGRCEACKGEGTIKIEMHFLPDVYVPCDTCKTLRYNSDTLEIRYKGYNIADILNMSVKEALSFFENIPAIRNTLKSLLDVGLGYIKLGQSATTLSGGEAQRVKLSKELGRRNTGRTLYLLDEPTTGLHFADVHKLLDLLNSLVELGNTVVVIEHNLEVIKKADHIIDLGPEGGDRGGSIVGSGTPEEIAQVDESHTGRFLKEVLSRRRPLPLS